MAEPGTTAHDRRRGVVMVAMQVILLAVLVVAPPGGWWPRRETVEAVGVLLIVAGVLAALAGAGGLGTSLTPLPTPTATSTLHTSGLYRFVRHPIYAGLLLAAAGEVVWSASGWKVAALLALFTLFTQKARFEERLLVARYPEYTAYAAHTPRFVPYFGGRSAPPSRTR